MLNIPSTVKELFKADGTRKNFRVHFPNGEMPDITNDNVVQESVSFTESICSQSVFKYGPAEASVLEFETVGIGNMYGMIIEASIEIDVSSLSAADIAAIEADEGDGTLDGSFYRVPLGTFKVDKCPRNHGAITHRQVTAYTTLLRTMPYNKSEFERAMSSVYSRYSKRKIDTYSQIIAKIGYIFPEYMEENFTKALLFDSSDMYQTGPREMAGEIVNNYRLRMTLTTLSTPLNYRPASNELWQINVGDFDYAGARRFISSAISTYGEGVDKVMNPVGYFSEFAAAHGATDNEPIYAVDYHRYFLLRSDQNVAYAYNSAQYTTDGTGYNDGRFQLIFPIYAKIELYSGSTVIDSFESTATVMPSIYKYTAINQYPSITLFCDPVESFEYKQNGVKYTAYRYDFFSSDFSEFFSSTMELMGMFVKERRVDKGFDFIHLDNSSPYEIQPGNYEEMWWDEFDVAPIGTVAVSYPDKNGMENNADIAVGNGESIYNMTDNLVLKNLVDQTLSNITQIIKTYFKPHVGTAVFTPTELTMQGCPWIEAGDALEIEAEDGEIVDTYALRIEMTGIQYLQMTITAEGGEIIEELS